MLNKHHLKVDGSCHQFTDVSSMEQVSSNSVIQIWMIFELGPRIIQIWKILY